MWVKSKKKDSKRTPQKALNMSSLLPLTYVTAARLDSSNLKPQKFKKLLLLPCFVSCFFFV